MRWVSTASTDPREARQAHGTRTRGLKAYGHPVMRVPIDPATFPDWCAHNGTTPGRDGRKKFIAAAVFERYGDQT